MFYKGSKQTSAEKSLLRRGDGLLAGTNIQISIEGLDVGGYTLLLERVGKERTTLVEQIRIDKKTKILIPSANEWLTIGNNIGDYKLIINDTAKGQLINEFAFMVLPASKEDRSLENFGMKNSSLAQTKFSQMPQINTNEVKNVFAFAKKTTPNLQAIRTRGLGSSIYKAYAPAVALVLHVKDEKVVSTGSGIILNNRGDIVTNHHVVEGADSLRILLLQYQENFYFSAKLMNCNPSRDLAYIKMEHVPDEFHFVELGSNSDVLVGDDVHAIGHPIGQPWVYTRGTIGQIYPGYTWAIEGHDYEATVIQTQTPLNPGNSGGPLITDEGKVVGINTWITAGAQGVNFAVSVDDIKDFYQNRFSYPCEKAMAPDTKNEPRIIDRLDTNSDGVIDQVKIDVDGDGIADILEIDKDQDGKTDQTHLDTNGDGYFETLFIQKPDMFIFVIDRDKDGKYDIVGYDYDKDFKVDKTESAVG